MRDHRVIRKINSLYHKHIYPSDMRAPSYRTVYLISKAPFTSTQLAELDKVISPSTSSFSALDKLSLDPDLASILNLINPVLTTQSKSLSDVQFLINERQKAIRFLTARNEELQSMPLWRVILKRLRRRLRAKRSR